MRIALTCPYHWFRGGGVKEHVLALEEEYLRRGYYVKVITPLPSDYDGPVDDTVITLGTSRTTTAFAGTAWQWAFSVDTDAIDDVFKKEKFDILHFHEPWLPVWGRQLALRSTSANVATVHGRFYDNMKAKTVSTVVTPYTKPMLKYFDAFTAASEVSSEYFRTLSSQPITVIPNGIDLAKYSKRPNGAKLLARSGKTIFYVGRLENRKGVRYLLKAFNELSKTHKDVHLIIGGSGPDEERLRQLVDELGISRVKFVGFVEEIDKIGYLHEVDLACFPSTYGEGFGIVLLEAMAADCPAVVGDNIGYAGVMKGLGALSLVNPRDTIDFSRRLELMLFNESLRDLWRQWSKDYVKQFDWPIIADQYLKVYEQAIEHHKHRHHGSA